MSSDTANTQRNTLVVVTGASRGLGRSIARKFAEAVKKDEGPFHLLLIARTLQGENGLETTRDLVLNSLSDELKDQLTVHLHPCDMSDAEHLNESINDAMAILPVQSPDAYKRVFLFLNAGTLGELLPIASKGSGVKDYAQVSKVFNLNFVSAYALSRYFVQWLDKNASLTLINTSTLCAKVPFPSNTEYCTSKAATLMLMNVLATELKDDSRIKALSFAPGIMPTAMTEAIAVSAHGDEGVVGYISDVIKKGKGIPSDVSAECVIGIVLQNEFTSGEYIDVYTKLPQYAPDAEEKKDEGSGDAAADGGAKYSTDPDA
eukprot:TRINITY_DN3365_c0_g1_i1.p1 TRINITY_DN3365_c0_g1~~TRINITY_DN3365_c0_g1_i1.p1  ORF type:complete len:318 (+),score=79.66 TRINITY_DN3365_c0_g1_i1:70-1023(+)